MADSDLGAEDDAGSTISITSTVCKVEYENGRTYHSFRAKRHPLPNDEREKERLDLQHHLVKLTLGKLFISPIDTEKSFQRVLDAGTGTGIWAIEIGESYPQCWVTGIDLSHMQPDWVPPNVEFQIDDLEDDVGTLFVELNAFADFAFWWTFTSMFDLVYSRNLVFSMRDWPRFFDQSFKNLNPGGYIELVDIAFPIDAVDDSLPVESFLRNWSLKMLEASHLAGSPLSNTRLHKQRLEAAGFENIVEEQHFWPQNGHWPDSPWHRLLGGWSHLNMRDGIEAMSMALFTRELGWTVEEVQVFLVHVRRELGDGNIFAYWTLTVLYGQKPHSAKV